MNETADVIMTAAERPNMSLRMRILQAIAGCALSDPTCYDPVGLRLAPDMGRGEFRLEAAIRGRALRLRKARVGM